MSWIQQLYCLIGTNWHLVWAIMSLALMMKSKTYRTTENIVHATAFRNKWDERSLAPQTQAHSESGARTRNPLTRWVTPDFRIYFPQIIQWFRSECRTELCTRGIDCNMGGVTVSTFTFCWVLSIYLSTCNRKKNKTLLCIRYIH